MRKGVETVANRGAGLAAAGLLCLGLLTGCMSSSDELSSGGSAGIGETTKNWFANVNTGGKGPIQVSPDTFAADVYCPPIQLMTGTHLISKYASRKEQAPENLMYQATIDEWARECSREGTDQTRIKIGLAGDVTPGPAWTGGEVALPVRVAIIPTDVEDAKPVYSEIIAVPVTLGQDQPSEAWTVIENKFLVAQNQPMKIVFGYDEGKRR
ncbi:hypothetical protein [Roseibium sp.]|uniref:hypothetical protein n=1 Tax=Roseibium sp. TaxID=1936156 RepID=UPI003A973171